jgi:hypothetical protein
MRTLITAILLLACAGNVSFAGEQTFGNGVSAADTVLVSDLLARPAHYLDQVVRVAGPVVNVCKKRGCWLEMASDREFEKIMVKVEDGVIVFPPEIVGQTLVAEGRFVGVPLDHDSAVAYLQQEASCQAEGFDMATVPAEGITIYRLDGTGAVVRSAEEIRSAAAAASQAAAAHRATCAERAKTAGAAGAADGAPCPPTCPHAAKMKAADQAGQQPEQKAPGQLQGCAGERHEDGR